MNDSQASPLQNMKWLNNIKMQQEKNHNKHVQWDEEKLKETEKNRGMFQKIDEPKTPYHKNSDSDEQEMEPEEKTEQEMQLDESLYKAKMNSNINCHKRLNIAELNAKLKEELEKYHETGDMKDEEEEEAERKRQEFKKKRAQHYNEFKLIQKMKQQRWEDQDD